jgi:hypothetical protein
LNLHARHPLGLLNGLLYRGYRAVYVYDDTAVQSMRLRHANT